MPGPVRVFLTNSGAEAVEGALKLARYATGRPNVISFFGAFHGRTFGALTLTSSKAKYHKGFGPLLPGVLHAPYAFSRVDPQTGARSHDPDETLDYLENKLFRYDVTPERGRRRSSSSRCRARAATSCRRRSGCGRCASCATGTASCWSPTRCSPAWAAPAGCGRSSTPAYQPDVLISAKGIASGLPLGAFMARAELMERWSAGAHGSTYGGSPVPCAAGLATLEVIQSRGPARRTPPSRARSCMAGLREIWQSAPAGPDRRARPRPDDRRRAAHRRAGRAGAAALLRARPAGAGVRRELDPVLPGAGGHRRAVDIALRIFAEAVQSSPRPAAPTESCRNALTVPAGRPPAAAAQSSNCSPSNRPRSSRYSSRPTPFGSRKYMLSSAPRSGPEVVHARRLQPLARHRRTARR